MATASGWQAVNKACDELTEAQADAIGPRPTPAEKLRMEQAMRKYIEALAPVVGVELAMSSQAAFEGQLAAIDRLAQYTATLAAGSMDGDDAGFLADLGAVIVAETAKVSSKMQEITAALDIAEAADEAQAARTSPSDD